MRQSVLFKRVILVVVLSLLLTATLTTVIYSLFSRTLFANIRVREMLPKARSLARLVTSTEGDGTLVADALLQHYRKDNSILGGYLLVTDDHGAPVVRSDELSTEEISRMDDLIALVLRGEDVATYSRFILSSVQMVSVGTPIRGKNGVTGALLIILPLYESMAAVNGLSSALLVSTLIVMPIVVILVYVVIGRITLPIRRMRDTALSMASGNFAIEADDTQRGEVGQLAASLNTLSRDLSRNLNQLTIERNRLRMSVDGLMEGFVSVDSLGRVTYSNQAVRKLFGTVDADAAQRDALIPYPTVWEAFDETIATSVPRVRTVVCGGRMIQATVNPITGESGQTAGAVGLFTDITESERLERTRRDYVANVSHELRTPLTAMRGLIEPLRDDMVQSEETKKRYYDILLRETLRLSRLIDDLMELSRLQSGKLSMEKSAVDLGMIVEDLADKYAYNAREKNQTFRLMTDPKDVPTVLTNADRAEQVLVILLDNAMKYTPEGGTISLAVRREGDHALLSVSDTGVGISPEDLPHVFDRFYKADKSHTGQNGSGLGLSIAREILESLGEKISVQSELGKGTTFTFTLACAPQKAEA
ncbi:MAG: HAMP domain-containing protein [Clostridia bacterium]|nr:HAMP domain-containing protein [Clostridia bacterium]